MLLIILFILYPLICYVWGRLITNYLDSNQNQFIDNFYANILLGLLVSNYFNLILKGFGLNWNLSNLITWFLPLIVYIVFNRFGKIKLNLPPLNTNFIIWTCIIIYTGISLFDVHNGIKTYWISNYGDLAFHIGMITSFAYADNFPPEYHLYPGLNLSYPYLINFWSASFLAVQDGWLSLKMIFTYQWIFIWLLVYGILDANKNKLIPWAILLGGGVYMLWDTPAAEMISNNLPWTALIETVWVPQRSAMFGLLCFVFVLKCFFVASYQEQNYSKLYLSVLVLSLMPLVHTYFWILSVAVCFFLLLKNLFSDQLKYNQGFLLCLLIFISVVSSFWIFFLSDKSSVLELMLGWNTSEEDQTIYKGLVFWLKNWWPIFLIFICFIVKSKQFYIAVLMLLLFIFGNFVQLSFWSYDQLKYFIALYILLLLAWNFFVDPKDKINLLLLILIIPACYKYFNVFYQADHHTVYSQAKLRDAKLIRSITPKDAIIAAKQNHNSSITLTGRKLYVGYAGTLWSHGIEHQEYSKRERALRNLLYTECRIEPCPDYLYWSKYEQDFWNREKPPKGFEKLAKFLYKIN